MQCVIVCARTRLAYLATNLLPRAVSIHICDIIIIVLLFKRTTKLYDDDSNNIVQTQPMSSPLHPYNFRDYHYYTITTIIVVVVRQTNSVYRQHCII